MNLIVRASGPGVTFVQMDDLNEEKLARVTGEQQALALYFQEVRAASRAATQLGTGTDGTKLGQRFLTDTHRRWFARMIRPLFNLLGNRKSAP